MKLYPLLLQAVPRQILWGGTKLKDEYHKTAPFERIAESWELTVRPEGVNTIANGPAAGQPLDVYLQEVGAAALGTSCTGDRFPLLIKFIDAGDDLSIQVHPGNEYAMAHEGEAGKTEMWVVMEAEPGAGIVYGLKNGVTEEDFRHAVDEGQILETLNRIEVHPGDVYYIPSGQVHALGAGVLIAEIQQSSNVTYRVYDYDRRQKDGSLRELHREKAKDVVKVRTPAELHALQFEKSVDSATIASGAYFKVNRYDLRNAEQRLTVGSESFLSLLCLRGDGEIRCGGESYPVRKGDSYFLPATLGEVSLSGNLLVLTSELQA